MLIIKRACILYVRARNIVVCRRRCTKVVQHEDDAHRTWSVRRENNIDIISETTGSIGDVFQGN